MPTDLFDLSGRVAVVTGGGTGLGKGMAAGLAQAGALVIVASRRQEVVDRAAAEVRATGGKAEGMAVDVTRTKELPAFFGAVAKRHGRLDILVNNAGTNRRAPALEYTEQDWDTVMDLNLKSVFFCCQAAGRVMQEQGGGKIINIGSMMSLFALPVVSAYAASKGGIVQLTSALATAWARDHIQVNAVLPGWIDTDLTKRARKEIDGLHDRVLGRTPAARWGAIDDFAGIAVFLASPAASYVTGTTLHVDGGLTML